MKSSNLSKTVKKYFPLFLLVTAFTLPLGCDTIISNVSELPEDPNEGADNPNDPDNEIFNLPAIRLTNNGFSLEEPFTINTRDLQVEWDIIDENGSTNNDFNYTFRARLAYPSEDINQISFTDLGSNRGFQVSELQETFGDEPYTFEIEASYSSGGTNRDTTFAGEFYVDAFQQRGFLFNPSTIRANNDGTYTAAIYLDEIESSDDLTAFSLTVSFNGNQITPIAEEIRVFDEENGFLNRDGVDEVIWFADVGFSSVTLDVGLAGNDFDPISGGGAVCEIVFVPTDSFNGTGIEISTSSVLKDSEGNSIEIEAFDQATLAE